ncbi:PorP/SprF family type IX secretion system membrane protein [Arcticibacter eurypsychrophilus]|uniref:PorP/SprF family type IX secretion system membrane protein n=1 Tax=Arcticibacter eurypsychrophilus TaxID=1434752 RepID=UPI00084DD731|nr:type IX secretion system membrane protein PorP/SprF [Arcticibacter eurypsychrophilus]
MRRIVLFSVCLWCSFSGYSQQKALFSQYMFNTLAINPAYPCVDESLTITALSRHQWVGFKGAPKTQTISIHTPIKESNTFVGALLINDQIGEVLKETGGYLTIAQRVAVGETSYLSVGFSGGASSFRSGYSEVYPYSPESVNDPVFADANSIRGNFGIGVMLFSKTYYVGLSSPQFYQRDFTSYNKETTSKSHYLAQAGVLLPLGYDFKLKPNVLIKYVNGSPIQIDLNANLLIKETLWLGASYRSADSFNGIVSVFITPDIQLGYSYDFANTEMAKAHSGSHEIMLKFKFVVKGRDHYACYF